MGYGSLSGKVIFIEASNCIEYLRYLSYLPTNFRKVVAWWFRPRAPNPFEEDSTKPREDYVHDQKVRDAVIKQGFNIKNVPSDLDAVIVGSGIGGLVTAALMSKAGKKVLVLEQHDQAGKLKILTIRVPLSGWGVLGKTKLALIHSIEPDL